MIVTAATITATLTSVATALGATVAGSALATAFAVAGWVGAAVIYGGMAISALSAPKSNDIGNNSATYKGLLQTQTDQNLPIPLLYGTCKLAGNRIWQDENSNTTVKRIVAFAEGEICDFSDIRLNDIPIKKISGIKVKKYYGTKTQVVDSIVGGKTQSERAEKVGSLKDIAYLAITVPKSAKIDVNYNLTAVVKGRKVRVYKNKKEYSIEYSENPAWILLDFLTNYNSTGICLNNNGEIDDELLEELFDLDSFLESAAFCDEQIAYKKTDKNGTEKTLYYPRFSFNMILDVATSSQNFIDEICRSCRGGLFVSNGKFQFKIDKAEPVSLIFNENDIIQNSEVFETIPNEEHYDIIKCSYISPEHAWQKVEATAELPEYRNGVPIEHSINIYSVTNFQQASRLAWYYINAKRLQPYFGSFKTTYKAYSLEVGDVITIDSVLMGLKNYKVKITSVKNDGCGLYTVEWRTYDERLYFDELGSKEPRVLISNLSDIVTEPDDVKNFNVIQSNTMFNFIWEQNADTQNSYEIRMGENWENATTIATEISGNNYSTTIPSKGLFKFWIKAFNNYNYSQNATLDIINVDSIPNLNEIIKINVLENLNGTIDDSLTLYQNTLKLKPTGNLWETTNLPWNTGDNYYQTGECWGSEVYNTGSYESQVYDIGNNLECIVSHNLNFISSDPQSSILVEWSHSNDDQNFSDWTILNDGTNKFRYCKFKITLKSPNNVQTVLTNFTVNFDVPDKYLDIEAEITDPEGLTIEYQFTQPPSIVATVNDNNNAFVVITEKTNKLAHIKAFTNTGESTTCKISLHARGF